MTTVPETRWRKSTRSGQQTNCVELANNLVAVRDSKSPAGPTLAGDVRSLIAAVKSGQLG